MIRCCLKNLTHQANPWSPSTFSASNQIPIGHVLMELLKIFLPEVRDFFQISVIVVVVVSRDSPPCILQTHKKQGLFGKEFFFYFFPDPNRKSVFETLLSKVVADSPSPESAPSDQPIESEESTVQDENIGISVCVVIDLACRFVCRFCETLHHTVP